jgi:hypothetical protein
MLLTGSCFKDRDREIISAASIDAGVDEMDAKGDYGQLDLYHVPIYVGKCLTSGRQGGFLVELGEWYDTPIAQAARKWAETNPDNVGASVAFTYAPHERIKGVYYGPISIQGRALLDVSDAACPWSGFVQIGEESMAKNIKDKLLAILGSEDLVAQGLAGLAKADKLTEENVALGVMHKESTESAEPIAEVTKEEVPDGQTAAAASVVDQASQPEAQPPQEVAGPAKADVEPDKMQVAELDDGAIQAIADRVAAGFGPLFAGVMEAVAALNAAVTPMEARLTGIAAKQEETVKALLELAKADDEKIVEKIGSTPRNSIQILRARGKEADVTKPKEPKAEIEAQKELDKANGRGKKGIFDMSLLESMAAVRADRGDD